MKRSAVLSLLLSVFVFIFGCVAYAASDEAQSAFGQKFVVTGGIDREKDTETTFDKSRTISGTAAVGSKVTIEVVCVNEKKVSEPETYSISVGSSGYFSQSVELSLGENIITVKAEKDGNSACVKSTIKRKKSEIKTELMKKITFPGV